MRGTWRWAGRCGKIASMDDKGFWQTWCADCLRFDPEHEIALALQEALHDRDRYHREAAYWREECINLTAEMLR